SGSLSSQIKHSPGNPGRFTNQKSPSVDCEQILKDFSDYASTETDKKKLIERYQRDWQLMAGNEEAQAKCVQVMNIRVNELKQAA
uniref:recombinase n=1 Tax=Escherichia coli TaxID=562 RepID=UPI00207BB28B